MMKSSKVSEIFSWLPETFYFIHIPTIFGRLLHFELNFYFSPILFLQITTSPSFYLSYLLDTLAYWVVQQHKRFISTNNCSFKFHLAYPDHYYNIFSLMNSREVGYPDAQCARGGIFKKDSISNLSCFYLNQ